MSDRHAVRPPQTSALETLAALAGTWRGSGSGEFPTMEPFEYDEEIVFAPLAAHVLRYTQRAWSPLDGATLHVESGIWRVAADGRLEATVALPSVAEVSEGTAVDGAIRLLSTSMGRAPGGAGLVASRRDYDLRGDRLSYEIHMGTLAVPTQRHIWARLARHG